MEKISTNTKQEQEREKLLRKVFSNVSHDLKTPIACIIGSLEVIEHMKETISIKDRDVLINTALTEAHRLDGLVSKMLDTAKP
jgi:K+-sensing histidine kinase KdpD